MSETLRVASWNVNSLKVRLPHLLRWLEKERPHLVGLQETKTVDENFPVEALREAGYRALFSGQKSYNGVALLSRLDVEPSEVTTDLPGLDDPQRRVVGAAFGDLHLLNLYVPNGSEMGSEKYAYKLRWLEVLRDHLRERLERRPRLVVMGDFNIAPDDRDVHDPEAWAGSVLVSEPEREALRALEALGLQDTFRLFDQEPALYSWWDYRQGAFRRNLGLRIDLILASPALAERCVRAWIDREPRRWERPSDHAPVLAEFNT